MELPLHMFYTPVLNYSDSDSIRCADRSAAELLQIEMDRNDSKAQQLPAVPDIITTGLAHRFRNGQNRGKYKFIYFLSCMNTFNLGSG